MLVQSLCCNLQLLTMPTPSLILVPARFKTGKLYTPLATTSGGTVLGASGDFNVTRATTATRVNANGNIESVASGIPRLDYFASGGTVGCPALLVEPSGSNLALQSENFTLSGSWNTSVAGRTLVTGNVTSTLDPYGGNVSDLLSDDNTASNTHRMYTVGNISITSGTTYSTSFFVKANTTPWFEIRLMQSNETDAGIVGTVFNLTSGTITSGSGTIQNYGNGWYRCTNIGTSNFTGNGRIFFYVYNSSGTKSYNGTSSNSLYIFGAQVETGSIATSYIPTTTGSVTRNADVVSVSGAVSGSIGQTEGTIYAEVAYSAIAATKTIVAITDGTTNNRIAVRLLSTTSIGARIVVGGSNHDFNQNITAIPSSGTFKIALAYKANDYVLAFNGTNYASTATRPVPATNAITIGDSGFSDSFFNDRIRAAALYTTRLTNAQLAALTTP
jgi:hypothetical protein